MWGGLLGNLFVCGSLLCCSTQLVNGTNYFIKVKTGDDEAVHLRVWKGFQDADLSALQLHSIKQGKSLGDALEYF